VSCGNVLKNVVPERNRGGEMSTKSTKPERTDEEWESKKASVYDVKKNTKMSKRIRGGRKLKQSKSLIR